MLQLDAWPDCGGTHALLVPFEAAGKLRALYTGQLSGPISGADCMLHQNEFRKAEDAIHAYKANWGLFRKVVSLAGRSTIPGHTPFMDEAGHALRGLN